MPIPIRIIFFGSSEDSVTVATAVMDAAKHAPVAHGDLHIVAVVTQPEKPVGRDKTLTKTPLYIWAEHHHIPVLTFPSRKDKPWLLEDEESMLQTLEPMKPDLLISASYGMKIPPAVLKHSRFGGINVHPSILPAWRGADPIPWTLLAGDHQAGVTVITLAESFDTGNILAQKKIPIVDTSTPDALRSELFALGADVLIHTIPEYLQGATKPQTQDPNKATYAGRMSREDGYIPWEVVVSATKGILTTEHIHSIPIIQKLNIYLKTTIKPNSRSTPTSQENVAYIPRMIRALTPWPGVWSEIVNTNSRIAHRRIKILQAHVEHASLVIDQVQLEGKKPVSFKQFIDAYGINGEI